MDYTNCAKEIVKELGGQENITALAHCATRLRFNLKDESIVDDAKVKAIKGVMGVMKKGGQYQVVIGNAVADCFAEIQKLGAISDTPTGTGEKKKVTIGSLFNSLLDVISGCMAPVLPALMVSGMVQLLYVILTNICGLDANTQTMQILNAIGQSGIYFMPLLIAHSAAKKFGSTPAISVAIMGVLLYPSFTALLATGEAVSFLGIPVFAATYSSCVIPPILIAYVLKWVEKLIGKVTPSWTRVVFKPMLVMLIMAPLAFWILGPIGAMVGDALAAGINWLQGTCGWLTLMIGGALMPLLVMTGMHYAFLPTAIQSISTTPGYDPFLLPGMLCSNIAQGAACIGVAIKTKSKDERSLAIASATSALFAGITEPAMYGTTLKFKKPFIAAIIGGGVSGLIAGIFSLKEFAVVSPSMIGTVGFMGGENPIGNFIIAIIAMVISFVVTLIFTLILFKDETPVETTEEAEETKAVTTGETISISSPINGTTIALKDVNDDAFASEVLGKGLAVIPSEGKVYAPFNGKVDTLFDTLHAIGLVSDDGVEMLIHIGLETVRLDGKGFTPHIKTGDTFKKGDLLMEFDIDFIKGEGYDITTPVLVTNADSYSNISIENPQAVTTASKVLALA